MKTGKFAATIFSEKSLTAFCAAVSLFYFIYRALLIFIPHPDIGGVEGNVIYFIQRILDGQSFYSDPEAAPYAIAQYSPFYYYLMAAVAKLFGVGPDDVYALFNTGRIVSLLLNTGFVAVVFTICRRIYHIPVGRSFAAATMAFVFLQITSFARPDSLYHFFFLLTLYLFLQTAKKPTGPGSMAAVLATALVAVLALLSKQTAVVLPVIIGLWFLIQKNYRSLFVFTAGYLGVIFLFLLCFYLFSDLSLMYKNAVLGINNGVSITWYWNVVVEPLYLRSGLILLPLFAAVLYFTWKENSSLSKLSGFILFSIFILLNGIALKLGSVPGYLTEWWTFLFILTASYWPQLIQMAAGINRRIPACVFAAVLLVKAFFLISPALEKVKALSSTELMNGYKKEKEVADMIRSKLVPGEKFVVFTNIYTPDSYISNFLFRHAVMPQMEIVAVSTYPMKKFDYTRFEKELQEGRFKWLLMKEKDIQKRFFNIRLDKYQLDQSMNGFNLYQFKN